MALGDQRLFPGDISLGEPWEPPKPEATATLWRYMSFAKFCWLLERRELFFALVSDMTDRYEGFISPPPSRKTGDRLQPAEYIGHEVLHEITQKALISCWTETDHESNLMWNFYAGAEGVAIRTTFQDLQVSILSANPELPVTIGRVAYVDYGQQEAPRFGLAPLFHKRVEYRGEEEVRAALPSPPWEVRLDPDGSSKHIVDIALDADVAEQRGRYIPVDLKALVKEVVLSPHCAAWFGQLVRSVVNRSPVEARVSLSSLKP